MSFFASPEIDLKDLPRDETFYLGRGDDGSLQFRNCHIAHGVGTRKLQVFEKLALALTERCRQVGRGVVYYYYLFLNLDYNAAPPDSKRALLKLPHLLYQDRFWTKRNERDWDNWDYATRHGYLNGSGKKGPPSLTDWVLPISIALFSGKTKTAWANRQTTCTVILYFNPHPHLGFKSEIFGARLALADVSKHEIDDADAVKRYVDEVIPLSTRVKGMDGLRESLEELSAKGEKWAKVQVRDIEDARSKAMDWKATTTKRKRE